MKSQRLIELPLSKSFQMAYQSLRVRFFRSLVTTMSLVLAVAFLTFSQTENDIVGGLISSEDPAFIQTLIKSGYDAVPADQGGEQGVKTSPKQRWIIFLSLLVCVVGIINAQLMSVTERFREIGTLKCLGALDRFIVRIFVIEATMQGLAGGLIGAICGALVALLVAIIKFGLSAAGCIPWTEVGLTMFFAMATGTFLSLLGVLYPAIIASRMLPVEAMRVEQ